VVNVRWFVGSACLAAAALLCVLAFRARVRVPEPAPLPAAAAPRETPQRPVPAAAPAAAMLASTTTPLTRVSAGAPEAELPHPHPITPQHERIFRENNLTFSLDGAVDVEDVPGIRRLLAIYRREFPEDSLVLQQGYELIADCLEQPGERTRAAAQRFYDTELASALRRHVRRHCLERP